MREEFPGRRTAPPLLAKSALYIWGSVTVTLEYTAATRADNDITIYSSQFVSVARIRRWFVLLDVGVTTSEASCERRCRIDEAQSVCRSSGCAQSLVRRAALFYQLRGTPPSVWLRNDINSNVGNHFRLSHVKSFKFLIPSKRPLRWETLHLEGFGFPSSPATLQFV